MNGLFYCLKLFFTPYVLRIAACNNEPGSGNVKCLNRAYGYETAFFSDLKYSGYFLMMALALSRTI